jgi:alkylhydroperoxidase family enzyme
MHAYKVTDVDINQLKVAGYSEDELYELTISAALGAGLARLNRGLELLKD